MSVRTSRLNFCMRERCRCCLPSRTGGNTGPCAKHNSNRSAALHPPAHLRGQREEVVELAAHTHELGEEGGVEVLPRGKPAEVTQRVGGGGGGMVRGGGLQGRAGKILLPRALRREALPAPVPSTCAVAPHPATAHFSLLPSSLRMASSSSSIIRRTSSGGGGAQEEGGGGASGRPAWGGGAGTRRRRVRLAVHAQRLLTNESRHRLPPPSNDWPAPPRLPAALTRVADLAAVEGGAVPHPLPHLFRDGGRGRQGGQRGVDGGLLAGHERHKACRC